MIVHTQSDMICQKMKHLDSVLTKGGTPWEHNMIAHTHTHKVTWSAKRWSILTVYWRKVGHLESTIWLYTHTHKVTWSAKRWSILTVYWRKVGHLESTIWLYTHTHTHTHTHTVTWDMEHHDSMNSFNTMLMNTCLINTEAIPWKSVKERVTFSLWTTTMARTSVLVSCHVVPPFLLLLSRKMSEDDKNRSRKIFSQFPQHRRAGFLRFEIGSLPSCSLDRRHFDQPEARARNTLPYYNP